MSTKRASNAFSHGKLPRPLYYAWLNMKNRCKNASAVHYDRYGERGITVCDEWKYSYTTFRDFAFTHGWQPGLQIDRIDNNQGYSPDNCRFVTSKVNNNNRSSNLQITYHDQTKTLSEWADDPRCQVNYAALFMRLSRGMSFEQALTTPKKH